MGYLAETLRTMRRPAPAGEAAAWVETGALDWLLAMPDDFAVQRAAMVAALEARLRPFAATLGQAAIAGALAAIGAVPRERFVCPLIDDLAYVPAPLDIGAGQIISHPLLVALLASAAAPFGGAMLDVGCGSGYQAAVLAQLATHVTAIEIVAPLADIAARRLAACGCSNVTVLGGDAGAARFGTARFDAIVVAAHAATVPPNLIAALKPGGRLVIPLGKDPQILTRIVKTDDGTLLPTPLGEVRFVPLTGRAAG